MTGPFVVEATIPAVMDFEGAAPPSRPSPVKGEGVKIGREGAEREGENFLDRMLEVLRKSPVLRLEGDLLKNMRSSQIFSVCGLPEVALRKAKRPAHVVATGGKADKEACALQRAFRGAGHFDG